MNKKVIIFDLDGTLLNTLEDLANSTNFALQTFSFPTKTIDEIRNFVGDGVAKLIERAIPDGKFNPNYNSCLEIFKQHYSKNKYNKTAPYNGILPLLNSLKTKNYKIAVVSNKFDTAVKELCQKYFPDLIDLAVGENENCGIKKKPSPDGINIVISRLTAKNENCVYVGDSDVDILTAKNANMPCISVLWGFRDKEFLSQHGASIFVNKPSEIIDFLDKNFASTTQID